MATMGNLRLSTKESMRAHILDTYFGEGEYFAQYEQFDSVYVKLSHGPYNYLSGTGNAKKVTEQIIASAYEHCGDCIGGYLYPIALDPYTATQQADAYLEAVFYVENIMQIPVRYHANDLERTNNTDDKGKYLGKYAVKTKAITEKLDKELDNVMLYFDPYTYRELFVWWDHVWGGYQNKFDFIIAQYNFSRWDDSLITVPNDNTQPFLLPEIPRENVKMWQYSDKYPAGDFFPDSAAADVNVWLGTDIEFRELLGQLSRWDRLKLLTAKFKRGLHGSKVSENRRQIT